MVQLLVYFDPLYSFPNSPLLKLSTDHCLKPEPFCAPSTTSGGVLTVSQVLGNPAPKDHYHLTCFLRSLPVLSQLMFSRSRAKDRAWGMRHLADVNASKGSREETGLAGERSWLKIQAWKSLGQPNRKF